ncbi:MAG: hypothetical protein M3R15_09680 [Acidobacteriota bacterium]|nr:hypothetical protein [Acidobacteriota bacterium]
MMNNQIFRTITLLSLFCIPAATSADAQSADRIVMKIPFDFVAGKKILPAGEYTVKPTLSSRVTLIRNADGRRDHTTILTMPVPPETLALAAKLVFHRYGDQYFLYQIWTPASERGGQLPVLRAERELAKEIASGKSEHRLVTLVVGQ